MIISKEKVDGAAYNNTESLMFSHNSMETRTMANRLDKAFITGVEFLEEYVYQYVQDLIIENQGLKLYKDNEPERFKELAVEFAEYCALEGWVMGHDGWKNVMKVNIPETAKLSTEELYDLLKKKRNR